ncbi:MAG: hypothetical protein KC468_35510, partial [Myxococcales bacterium]|nr:hypothetical protein [Myxococcales bacterium]
MGLRRAGWAPPVSLTARITLAMAALVLITSAVIISLIFTRIDALLVATNSAMLERESELLSTRLLDELGELERDVLLVAGMPPIQGMIRAERNGGEDPRDG